MSINSPPPPSILELPHKLSRLTKTQLSQPKEGVIDPFDTEWDRAVSLFETHHHTEALSIIDDLLLNYSERPILWYGKAVILLELEDYKGILVAVDQALKLSNNNLEAASYLSFKNNPGLHYLRVLSLYMLGKFHDALSELDVALKLESDLYSAWLIKGVTHVNLQQYGEAIKAYSQAVDLKPEYSEIWYSRACAYSLYGNHMRAIQDLSQAIEIEPSWRDKAQLEPGFNNISHLNKFKILIESPQDDQQIDENTKAIPDHPWMKFAGMYKDDPDFDDYIERIAAYRREIDEGRDVPEETIADRIQEILN